jgi:glycerophosphoryl diester phosphodiesterase
MIPVPFKLAIGVCLIVTSASAEEGALLFAHRGGAGEFEENSMAAFKQSYEHGLRGFETDVRLTKDGEFVILHDDDLSRIFDAQGAVEHKTAAELRRVKTKKSGLPLLQLDELLDYFADKPGVYLELEMKTSNKELYPDERMEEYCRKLYDIVRARRPKGSDYVLTSFDERPLKRIKSEDPSADLLLISSGPCGPEIVRRAQQLGVKRIGVKIGGTSRDSVQAAQKAGLRVSCWPGHNLQDYFLGVGLGVNAICSDVPVAIQKWKTAHE